MQNLYFFQSSDSIFSILPRKFRGAFFPYLLMLLLIALVFSKFLKSWCTFQQLRIIIKTQIKRMNIFRFLIFWILMAYFETYVWDPIWRLHSGIEDTFWLVSDLYLFHIIGDSWPRFHNWFSSKISKYRCWSRIFR